jgi:predicted RNA-binding protein with PUA domain
VEEFDAMREPWRSRPLVAGAQAAAMSFGKNLEIYEDAIELLHA